MFCVNFILLVSLFFKQGVPIRIELGPRDVKNNQVVAVRRDTGDKIIIPNEKVCLETGDLLKQIQSDLFLR